MNKWEKELAALELKGERKVLQEMREHYDVALRRVNIKIEALADRDDLPGIRQRRYQEALAEQIGSVLDELRGGAHETLGRYLADSYEHGFVGALYDLQKQGIPLAFPIDQDAMARAVSMSANDVKLSKRIYGNVDTLQRQVIAEITRGFADAESATKIAERLSTETDIKGNIKRNVAGRTDQAFRRSMTIARTEKGRVKAESGLEAMRKAKAKGADVVKQWDSTMDSRTRPDHVATDGQVRELEEPFSLGGSKALAPHMTGVAHQDVNCRCVCLQRARSALECDDKSTKWDGVNQCYVDLSDATNYEAFKSRYEDVCAGAVSTRAGRYSGAYNDDNDPYMEKRDTHAARYYEEVRNRNRAVEVSAVATNSGIEVEDVEKAYDHLFINEYDLLGGHVRFDPYYEIAESWRRLREGKKVRPHDITLLSHESLEYDLMRQDISYEDAHKEAERVYNYAEELRKFEESGGV